MLARFYYTQGGAICFTNGIIGMERIDGFLWWNLSPWSERDYGCGILPGAFIFFSNTEENNSEWIVKQLWIRNNKTNIKFWFRIIWKIMQTLKVVKLCEAISIGFLYWWITTSSIYIIFHIIPRLIHESFSNSMAAHYWYSLPCFKSPKAWLIEAKLW